MTADFHISFRLPTEDETQTSLSGLDANSIKAGGVPYTMEPYGFQLYDGKKLIGLLSGKIAWDWMYIDILWVDETQRSSGLGTKLMQAAEIEARKRNLVGIYLTTQTWEAPTFYKKMGYDQFAEMPDFPRGHKRFYYRKFL